MFLMQIKSRPLAAQLITSIYFSKKHTKNRVIVEHGFGQLKRQFQNSQV